MQRLRNRSDPELPDGLIIGLNGFLRNIGDAAGVKVLLKRRKSVDQVLLSVDGLLNAVRSLEGDLAAVRAVHFVSVELCGIVGCGDHDAGGGLQMTHGKGKHRRRLQTGIQEDPNAHRGENGGRELGKIAAVDAAVKGNGTGRRREGLLQITGEAAGCLGHGEQVHPVAPGAEYAAKTACAESQITVEAVVPGVFVHGAQVGEQLFVHGGTGQPGFVLFGNGHFVRTSL